MTAFADTGYYVALLNPRDRLHAAATDFCNSYRGAVVTSEYVLIELGNFLGASARESFLGLCRELREDAHTKVVPSSSHLFEDALSLYAAREDKQWSMTDCSSFVVMREMGIGDALTFDHHFEQAGFRLMPGIG